MGKNTCLTRLKLAFVIMWITSSASAPTAEAATQTAVPQRTHLVTEFKSKPSLSYETLNGAVQIDYGTFERKYFEVPRNSLAGLRKELKNWWLEKNSPDEKAGTPAHAYRGQLLQEAMRIVYRDQQKNVIHIMDEEERASRGLAPFYGPAFTALHPEALGKRASALALNLAANGQVGILTEVHFRVQKEGTGGRIRYVPVTWSFSIVIRVSGDGFINLLDFPADPAA